MENNSIGQYRSHDSPKNFVIKVLFWKVTPGSVVPAHFQTNNGTLSPPTSEHQLSSHSPEVQSEKEELFIHWQEKLFSGKEFDRFSDPLNCITALEKKYHEDIEYLKSSIGGRPNSRVFTYIDSDSDTVFEEFNKITLGPSSDEQNTLVNKMAQNRYGNTGRQPVNQTSLRMRNVVTNDPSVSVKANHVISTPLRTMKIMADVGFTNSEGNWITDERIICTIKINANGLIVLQPDIETEEEFTIETYYDIRCVYRYKFQHASLEITPSEMQQEDRLFSELYTRHAQLMASHVGNEMHPLPAPNELFLFSFCEIVSAKDFEYDDLYVSYCLDMPIGWCGDSSQLNGVTQRCSMDGNLVAHFSFPFEFQLGYAWSEETPCDFISWPTLYFQVYSLDSWQRHRIEGYGYCQLPDVAGSTCVEIDMWRPEGDDAFDPMRRFFIGGSPELRGATYVKETSSVGITERLNKFQFKTKTTGILTLKFNTLLQTKAIDSSLDSNVPSKYRKNFKRASGFQATFDSLTQVVDAFQRARKRMVSARSSLPVAT